MCSVVLLLGHHLFAFVTRSPEIVQFTNNLDVGGADLGHFFL